MPTGSYNENMRNDIRFGVILVVLAASGGVGASPLAPPVSVKTIADLPTPLPYPYDEQADAHAALNAAFARARANGKRVLIDFGGNWCGDCRVLAGIMELPEVKTFITQHYDVVTIDVGRYTRNMDIAAQFGLGKLAGGVPEILVAEANGKLINVSNAADLEDARHMTPQALADWLARWAR